MSGTERSNTNRLISLYPLNYVLEIDFTSQVWLTRIYVIPCTDLLSEALEKSVPKVLILTHFVLVKLKNKKHFAK